MAAYGEYAEVDVAGLRGRGAVTLVDRVGDRPFPSTVTTPVLLVAVPPDIELIRRRDPVLAAELRHAVRAVLTGALAAGYRISGIARDGFYALEAT